jgi:hypothetical protein
MDFDSVFFFLTSFFFVSIIEFFSFQIYLSTLRFLKIKFCGLFRFSFYVFITVSGELLCTELMLDLAR